MKTEIRILLYSMINNIVITIIKVIGGIIFNLNSLLADGLQTFSDFLTDVFCLIGSKISRKKPTKYHPFGFGKIEYLINLVSGMILFILGLFIIISSFFKEAITPPLYILILLLIVFILKLIAIYIMNKIGKNINSSIIISSVEESKADLYSTIGVAIITVLLQFSDKIYFLKYADIVGSILMGIVVIKTAFKILIDNSLCLIGEVELNEKLINNIKNILKEYKEIIDYQIILIKYGAYYKLQLNLIIDNSLNLKQITNVTNKVKKNIKRHRSLKIKYVNIYVTNNFE